MISTASYAARAFGVRSAMPGFVAKQLCPQLIFVDHDGASYKAAASQARAVFANYDPSFVSGSLDEASLNLTAYLAREGVYPARDASEAHEHLQPGRPPNTAELKAIEGIVSQLRARVFDATGGLTCSAGIAPNHILAKICSDLNKPNGQTLCPFNRSGVVELMQGLPARKIPGVGRVTERELAELGVAVCGDIGARLGVINAALGERTAQWLARCALGLTETSARSFGESGASDDIGRKSISQERTFSDTHSWAELSSRCKELSATVAAQLRDEGLLTSCVTVKGKLHTFEVLQHGHSLLRPTDDAETIAAAAVDLLREVCSSGGDDTCRILRLLGVRLSALKLAVPKPTLLDDFLAHKRPEARPLVPASRSAMGTGSAVAGDIVDLSGLGDESCSDSDSSGDCVMLYHGGLQIDAAAAGSATIRSGASGTLATGVVPATELADAGNANRRTSSSVSDLLLVVPVRPRRDAGAADAGCAPPVATLLKAQRRLGADSEPGVVIASDSEPEDSAQALAPVAVHMAGLPGLLALAAAGRPATQAGVGTGTASGGGASATGSTTGSGIAGAESPSELEPESESRRGASATGTLTQAGTGTASPVGPSPASGCQWRAPAPAAALPVPVPPHASGQAQRQAEAAPALPAASLAPVPSGSESVPVLPLAASATGSVLRALQAGPRSSRPIELESASPPSNALVLCPVCGRMLPSLQSERHIDVCLQRKKRKRQNAATVVAHEASAAPAATFSRVASAGARTF